MDVGEAIRNKRAVRRFENRAIPEDDLGAIVDAGRRAQSAKNLQQWHFMVVRERGVLISLVEANHYAAHLKGAPAAIAILTPIEETGFTMFDAGQAVANMQLRALELGIATCIGAIEDSDHARGILGFPDDIILKVVLSVGYAAAEQPARISAGAGAPSTM